jgi:hypothetical protein
VPRRPGVDHHIGVERIHQRSRSARTAATHSRARSSLSAAS